jgi:hypothetical protein
MHTDEPTLREHLGKAEHHVAEAEQRVADQRELVLELVGSGRLDLAKTARDGLEELKELLAKPPTATVSLENLLRRLALIDPSATTFSVSGATMSTVSFTATRGYGKPQHERSDYDPDQCRYGGSGGGRTFRLPMRPKGQRS